MGAHAEAGIVHASNKGFKTGDIGIGSGGDTEDYVGDAGADAGRHRPTPPCGVVRWA